LLASVVTHSDPILPSAPLGLLPLVKRYLSTLAIPQIKGRQVAKER
jgi:hypothetical protein